MPAAGSPFRLSQRRFYCFSGAILSVFIAYNAMSSPVIRALTLGTRDIASRTLISARCPFVNNPRVVLFGLHGGGRLYSRENKDEEAKHTPGRSAYKRKGVGVKSSWDSFGDDERRGPRGSRGGRGGGEIDTKVGGNRYRDVGGDRYREGGGSRHREGGVYREDPPQGANWKWKNGKKWYDAKQKKAFDPPEGFEHVYGVNSVVNALTASKRKTISKLYIRESSTFAQKKDKKAYDEILKAATKRGVEISSASKHDLNMMTDNRPHQDFVLVASPIEPESIPNSEAIIPPEKKTLFLALDEISDPQNLGALLRTSAFFGAGGVVVSEKNCSPLTPTVSKASSGALEVIDVNSTPSMVKFLKNAREEGWKIVGTSVGKNSVSLDEIASHDKEVDVLGSSIILVLGSEGRGLRPVIKDLCHVLVKIEGSGPRVGNVDSLNVSASGAVLIYTLKALQQQQQQQNKHVASSGEVGEGGGHGDGSHGLDDGQDGLDANVD